MPRRCAAAVRLNPLSRKALIRMSRSCWSSQACRSWGTGAAATVAGRARAAVGQTLRVLVEGKLRKDGLLEGLSDEYLTVQFAGPPSLARSFAHVRIDEERDGVLFGELATPSERVALKVAG